YSKNRASFHEKPDMSVHGDCLIAAGKAVSRMTTCATASLSPPGCQGRPREKLAFAAELTTRLPTTRNPYGFERRVLAAVRKPLLLPEPRSSAVIVARSNTAVARP